MMGPHGKGGQMAGVPTGTEAHAANIAGYRRSAGFRLRFALWRSLLLIVTIYALNVLLNLGVLIATDGPSALLRRSDIADAFLLSGLAAASRQLPSLAGSLVAVAGISLAMTVTARLRYHMWLRSRRKRLAAAREQRKRELQEAIPGARITSEADEAWLVTTLDQDAPQRLQNLQQIKDWVADDPLLAEWVTTEIGKLRFSRDLWYSVAAAASAVLLARVLAQLI
jgi:hypothetical protein